MTTRRTVLAGLTAMGCLVAVSGPLMAETMNHDHGPIMIKAPFARASASAASKSGAAYMQIMNMGDTADRLIAAKGDAAAMIQLHTHIMKDGAMTMTEIEGGVEIPAGGHAEFKPGAEHIMLMGLHAPLVKGETLHLTLVFEKAGEIAIEVPIMEVGAKGAGMGHSGDHSGHGSSN